MSFSEPFSRRSLLRAGGFTALTLGIAPVLAACSGNGGSNGGGAAVEDTGAATTQADFEKIMAAAKEEGKINLIALPPTWANYKGVLEEYTRKFGVETDVASPDASSADELTAVRNFRGTDKLPDALDVGYSFTKPARQQNAIGVYRPTTWDTIPDSLKDPDGYWVGSYYGVITMGVNTNEVPLPESVMDLKKPEYKGKVAIPGDPRKGASSVAAVITAAVANGGGAHDVEPGIDFFAELTEMGNMVTINNVPNALSSGQAAVVFDWSYNFVGHRPELEKSGVALEAVIPADAAFGTYYAQSIVPDSPHPNAARCWINHLVSDEGAEQYALGGAVPARIDDLVSRGALSDEALAMLPSAEALKSVVFPTIEEGDAANAVIAEQWGDKVKTS